MDNFPYYPGGAPPAQSTHHDPLSGLGSLNDAQALQQAYARNSTFGAGAGAGGSTGANPGAQGGMPDQRLGRFPDYGGMAQADTSALSRLSGLYGNSTGMNDFSGDMASLENKLLLQRLQAANQANIYSSFGNNTLANTAGWGAAAYGANSAYASLYGNAYPNSVLPQAAASSQSNAVSSLLGKFQPDAMTAAAGLNQQMGMGQVTTPVAQPPPEPKKKPKRKRKDKPKRPLSAYNLFFKDERARILDSIPNPPGKKRSASDPPEEDEEDSKEIKSDDKETASQGSSSKKRKKIPHGKIGFESLAKVIGQKWQELDSEKAEYYKKLAEEDMKRYKEEMEVFLTKEQEKEGKKDGDDKPRIKKEDDDVEETVGEV